MERRRFLVLLGSAAAFPPTAAAQQSLQPRVGVLSIGELAGRPQLLASFRVGLGAEGFVHGRNVTVEAPRVGLTAAQLPKLAEELVQTRVAAIMAYGAPAALAAMRATSTTPIVFATATEPVESGLVKSINRPDGNVTGNTYIATELAGKRLELLRELVPSVKRVAILLNPNNPNIFASLRRDLTVATRSLKLEAQEFSASTLGEVDAAFAALVSWRADVLFVAPDAFFSSQRAQLVKLASDYRIPTSYSQHEFVEAGGLMRYGAHTADGFRQAGVYVGRILKGAKPSELPVLLPTRFELAINLKTAKALGIDVPPTLLAIADEVIE